MVEIHFEDIDPIDITEDFVSDWFDLIVSKEELDLGDIEIFFCSDEYILKLNKETLDHDYYTDIITFDYRIDTIISGDLFISVDRVRDNANTQAVSFMDELHRVCAHGLLHICGYGDKTEEEIAIMRIKENESLDIRP